MKKTLTLYPPLPLSAITNSGARTRRHQLRKKKDRCGVSPSELVIRNLLDYSHALTVLRTKETGFVNLMMN